MRFDVLTLFPELLESFRSEAITRRAVERGLIEIHCWNFRDWTLDKHQKVDDRPYGGGPGMVLMPQPIFDAVEAVQAQCEPPGELIMLTPAGQRLTQRLVEELATKPRLVLLCGRYEGFDERVRLGLRPREVSIGDFVCNGGEVPAMVIIETVMRLVPGVLGDEQSVVEESFAEPDWLEYPQYTRPLEYRGMSVPPILRSGHHGKIAAWRAQQARLRSSQQNVTGSEERTGHGDPSAAGESPVEQH